jgi:hypothetical protein
MSILPIKYLTDFPFGFRYISGTLNEHHLNIRTILYLILYTQKYLILLYKDIRGTFTNIRINALTRLIQYYDYVRFLLNNCNSFIY